MTSREQFEAWCINRLITVTRLVGGDTYQTSRTRELWEAWKASREAMEVELPSVEDKKWYSSWHGKFREEAFWLEVKRRLVKLGLKVKQ